MVAAEPLDLAVERHPGLNPVVLVHGFASDARSTWEATGWYRALSEAGRGVIAVDLRGHGASPKPDNPDSYSPSVLASDIVCVLDVEGVQQVDIIGYSMGSQVARQLAADHPSRVSSLVLGGIGTSEQFARWGARAVREALIDGISVDDPVLDGLLAAAAVLPLESRLALTACAEGMAQHPVTAIPDVSTLVVTGELDHIAEGADRLAMELGAAWITIPGRHHGSTVSARAFKQAAVEFIQSPK